MMTYEEILEELQDVQQRVDAIDGIAFSLTVWSRTLREQIARMELGVQRTIDTQDDLK